MNIIATVLRTSGQSLLVRDESNGQEILVHYRNARRFSPGDRIRITFNGQMTFSIPPQITATAIERLNAAQPGPQPGPSQMRAVVQQRGANFLLVMNTQDRRQYRVEYRFAQHFCVGQQIIVSYDTITLSNPPRVTATEITPVC